MDHVSPQPAACPSGLTVHPLRLLPGTELRAALLQHVEQHGLRAAFVLTCCGSLTRATLRMASHTPADGNNKVGPTSSSSPFPPDRHL